MVKQTLNCHIVCARRDILLFRQKVTMNAARFFPNELRKLRLNFGQSSVEKISNLPKIVDFLPHFVPLLSIFPIRPLEQATFVSLKLALYI